MRWAGCTLLGLAACGNPDVEPARSAPPPSMPELRTTSGELALARLEADIGAAEAKLERTASIRDAERVVQLRLLRSQNLGSYEQDFARAESLAEAFGAEVSTSVDRALHRFGTEGEPGSLGEAARLVAVGKASVALPGLETAAEHQWSARVLLAAALQELGRFDEADAVYVWALETYPSVSPFPVASIWFRRGVLWAELRDQVEIGEAMYRRGLEHLPQHVTLNVHLAEIEWSRGDTEAAVQRLERVLEAEPSDPEPAGLRAEIDRAGGGDGEPWLTSARESYERLLETYPEAFADHGSEFFAGPGEDPERALALARANLERRPTERAVLLVIEAALAAGELETACGLLGRAATRKPLVDLLRMLRDRC